MAANTWSKQNLCDVVCSPRNGLPLEVPAVDATPEGVSSAGDDVTSGFSLLRDELGNELWLEKVLDIYCFGNFLFVCFILSQDTTGQRLDIFR